MQFPLAHPAAVSVLVGAERPEQLVEDVGHAGAAISSQLWGELVDERLLRGDGADADLARDIKIDAHHHLWDPTSGLSVDVRSEVRSDSSPIRPRRSHRRNGRHRGLGDGARADRQRHRRVRGVLAAADSASAGLIAGVIGWVDLTAPSVEDELACSQTLPVASASSAIRHQVEDEPDPHWMGRADVSIGLEAVGQAGLVYDLLVRSDGIAACVDVAAAHEDLQFVLDHAGKPPMTAGAGHGATTRRTRSSSQRRCQTVGARHRGRAGGRGLFQRTSLPSSTTCSTPSAPAARCSARLARVRVGRRYETVVATAEALTAGLSAANTMTCSPARPSRIYALSLPERRRVARRSRAREGTTRARRRGGGPPPWPSPVGGCRSHRRWPGARRACARRRRARATAAPIPCPLRRSGETLQQGGEHRIATPVGDPAVELDVVDDEVVHRRLLVRGRRGVRAARSPPRRVIAAAASAVASGSRRRRTWKKWRTLSDAMEVDDEGERFEQHRRVEARDVGPVALADVEDTDERQGAHRFAQARRGTTRGARRGPPPAAGGRRGAARRRGSSA